MYMCVYIYIHSAAIIVSLQFVNFVYALFYIPFLLTAQGKQWRHFA